MPTHSKTGIEVTVAERSLASIVAALGYFASHLEHCGMKQDIMETMAGGWRFPPMTPAELRKLRDDLADIAARERETNERGTST